MFFCVFLKKRKKKRKIPKKNTDMRDMLSRDEQKGKSNITRVNFSAFLLVVFWKELNNMKNPLVLVEAKSLGMWCMCTMKTRMEQCEAISFCGHFRLHYELSLRISFSSEPLASLHNFFWRFWIVIRWILIVAILDIMWRLPRSTEDNFHVHH